MKMAQFSIYIIQHCEQGVWEFLWLSYLSNMGNQFKQLNKGVGNLQGYLIFYLS